MEKSNKRCSTGLRFRANLFLIYIKDLDSKLISKIGKFADDTKLCKGIGNSNDVENLRSDLNKLSKWSKDCQMEFNIDKCSVIHIGAKNGKNKYSFCDSKLRVSSKERDLGIIMDDKLKFTEQCNNAVKNANITLGMIKRSSFYHTQCNIGILCQFF